MNIRWIFLDMQNYIRKVTRPLAKWIYFLLEEAISPFFFRPFWDSVSSPDHPVGHSHLAVIAKSAETQKRNTNAAGRVWKRVKKCANAKCSLHNLPARVVVTLTAISLYYGYNVWSCWMFCAYSIIDTCTRTRLSLLRAVVILLSLPLPDHPFITRPLFSCA